jgi:hypothetical protein
VEGDEGACDGPTSDWRCGGGWRAVEDARGEIGRGRGGVAEEGSREDAPRELGGRSGREE